MLDLQRYTLKNDPHFLLLKKVISGALVVSKNYHSPHFGKTSQEKMDVLLNVSVVSLNNVVFKNNSWHV